jgi:hypothetical protein
LLATVVGQDLEQTEDGTFRIARRVARDRVISTVGPDARHVHKTSARGFDGYKGHVSVDPDSGIVVATAVTAGNVGDAVAAAELLADDLPKARQRWQHRRRRGAAVGVRRRRVRHRRAPAPPRAGRCRDQLQGATPARARRAVPQESEFRIDLDHATVTCPAGHTVPLTKVKDGRIARFGALCTDFPLAPKCTEAANGRTIHVGPHERRLATARARQADPE